MSFEEQLLMDLKVEFAARADRRRRSVRRVSVAAAVAGLAAAAAIAVPLLTGTESQAYAVTENTDGTISVQIKEFKDADKLERDLKALNVPADITYLKPGKACEPDRGRLVEGKMGMTPQEWEDSVHHKVADLADGSDEQIDIHPRYIGKGQTLVMEISESGRVPEGPRSRLMFRGLLITGKVKPCTVVDAHYELRGGPIPSTSVGR
ncbi:hypothetical protein [Nonomuraea jiangxiensis]|uniref:Uncharacterized protein n=1 Tax=Nonomuraea jiangxiensis TaxID=633440 RepID=A0A1G9LLA7_9ACTN|nr:hypothetical protein [Nonomuraea jiangxiensis]SDL62527.1 hypothetical protein SAMN05421869_12842 [Nonomuraea jiangxiensis]